MRSIPQIKRDLAAAEAVVAAGGVEQRDNDGRVVMTAGQHRAAYQRRAARLRRELAVLVAIFGAPAQAGDEL